MPNSIVGPGQDPVMTQFDRLIAFIVYVLLFIGVFTFGVPSIVGLALALAHGADTHPVLRSHYRHQVRIFWMGAFCIVGAVIAGFAGSGVWLAALVTWAEKTSGVSMATVGVSQTGQQAWIGGVMLATSVSLVLFGAAWTLLQSLFGFLRLAGNRPIGHTPVA